MDLGDKLKYLRNRKRMSLQELTDDLNKYYINENGKNFFAKGKLSKWESGNVDPATSALVKVAKYFNVSLDYLTGLEDENDRHPVVEIPVFSNVNKQSNSSKEEYLSFYKYIAESYKYSKDELFYFESEDSLYLVNKNIEFESGKTGLFKIPSKEKAVIRKGQIFGENILLMGLDEEKELFKMSEVEFVGTVLTKELKKI